MEINQQVVKKIAKLARLKIEGEQAKAMEQDLTQIMSWIKQLEEVDTEQAKKMISVSRLGMPQREDVVSDGDIAQEIVKNAPEAEFNMFVVPKMVE